MSDARIIVGDNRVLLKRLEAKSIQTVITSPPYWGLRDYGTGTWIGGDKSCKHIADKSKTKKFGNAEFNKNRPSREATKTKGYYFDDICGLCGAIKKDQQIGLETTPAEFVEQLCLVFDEVWRVLKDDGTLWLNIGDSYFYSTKGTGGSNPDVSSKQISKGKDNYQSFEPIKLESGELHLKHKDLVGIPWRVAFALQERGWYLRQDIIWAKPNPMPESVTDRCTKSHEYLFLLTKSPKYYFDNEAIKEPAITENGKPRQFGASNQVGTMRNDEGRIFEDTGMRNKRDVWFVPTKPYKEAHFATYPPELITPCVLAGSKPDDWVLDPFSGSGTTGEVAMQFGRNYVGLELNPEYAALSEKRLLNACGLFGQVIVEAL